MNKSLVLLVVFILPIICCQSRLTETTMEKDHPANRLIHTTSPYLQQHAYNPVDWYPWGEEALTKAKEEDKMILVSIGYSSCHWCHVMERETFENDSIAAVMNASFINIKVDREERPDIDQIYMDAVQAMGINGGWPLNVFLTPDQKPFYGGTYFPPDNWVKMLQSLSLAFRDKREEIENSANSLVENLTISERKKFGLEMDTNPYDISLLDQAIEKFRSVFDKERGGFNRAPKFPLPSNWQFLLRYASSNEGEGLMAQSLLTLDRIQQGGIYDHLGGGFARYSTDARWFAPHFEKMLYDNGQLLSLYSEAYMISGKESYRQTVYETIDWIEREMMDEDGAFYSAIDADSEGEEGKFYVWKASALREFLGEDYSQFAKFYGVKEDGNWESGNNILFRSSEEAEFALKNGLDIGSYKLKLKEIRTTLLQIRNNRIKPATDTKVLSGWNALALKGLLDAYNAFGERRFLDMALKNAEFIQEKMIQNGQLMRSYKDGISNIAGYLEDYAFTISAFHSLYEATFNEKWLTTAENLLTYTLDNFLDKEENLFYFTSNKAEELIARKKDIFDNVIPSSNSQMALNLHMMGLLLDKSDYLDLSDKMLRQVTTLMAQYPGELSNWASLYTHKSDPTAEIVIVGEKMEEFRKELSSHFLPNKVIMGTLASSELPLFENRSATKGETTVYVCYNKTCKLPVNSVEATLKLLEE